MAETIKARASRALNTKWYKIDTAGTLYPSTARKDWNSAFRMTAVLKEPVDADTLQNAVNKTLLRFPTMAVKLRSGLFWYYFEENEKPLIIRPENGRLCKPFVDAEENGHLLRVMYSGNRILVEFFHAITDGTGGMTFLITLTAAYLRLRGMQIPPSGFVLDVDEQPRTSELEDGFARIPKRTMPKEKGYGPAYHFPGEPLEVGVTKVISFAVPADTIKKRANELGVSVTAYIGTILLYFARETQMDARPKQLLPLRVSIPINLRRHFEADTLRNFSWFTTPGIEGDSDMDFAQIATLVSKHIKEETKAERLEEIITPNAMLMKNKAFRLVPLPVKNAAISVVYSMVSDRTVTATMSNLGIVRIPKEMESAVEHFEFCLGSPTTPTTNCTILTTGNRMMLSFTSKLQEPKIAHMVANFLLSENAAIQEMKEKEYR